MIYSAALFIGSHFSTTVPTSESTVSCGCLSSWLVITSSFVTDLDLRSQPVPVERFLSKLTQQYALNTVLQTTSEEGFEVAEKKNNLDGSIELVVTRWDP